MGSATEQLKAIREFLSRPGGAALAPLTPESLADELKKAPAQVARCFLLRQPHAERIQLRFDEHLDLQLDGFVVDPALGTIGLIVLLGDVESAPGLVRETIEKAAYLRHVLGQKRAEEVESTLLPYAIEVLFVSTDTDTTASRIVGEIVRESWRDTSLPHALGIGFAQLLPSADERQLRRAFCWLLTATRAWLSRLTPGTESPRQEWSRLRLENFRRPQMRNWTKSPERGLHVLHGPNGSGKSSLVEGFEFLVTGYSTRLGLPIPPATALTPTRFSTLIWHPADDTPAPSAATVQLFNSTDKKPLAERTTLHVSAEPNPAAPPADAFRLNQHFTDRLMSQSTADRARTWLDAFFPGEDQNRRARREARAALQQAIAAFSGPAATTDSSPITTSIVTLAGRLAAQKGATVGEYLNCMLGPERFLPLQSLSNAGLKSVATFPEQLFAKGHALDNEGELHKRLKEAFTEDAALLVHWKTSLATPVVQLLQRLGEDSFVTSPAAVSPRNRTEIFNQWLRHVALVDLHERALVVATVAQALPSEEHADFTKLIPDAACRDISTRRDELIARRDQQRQDITTLDIAKTRARGADYVSHRVQEADLGPLLQAIAHGLFTPLLQPGDEPLVRAAVRRRVVTPVREIQIGSPQWTSRLLALAAQRQEAVDRLLPLFGDPPQPDVRALALIDVIKASLRVSQRDSDTAGQFLATLVNEGLDAAVDEVVALFTPARWAYSPLATEFKETDTGDQLRLRAIKTHDASEIFNTAELNTVALALHLLCAPRVANAYRVVFLDDPLQNMDELTVTTVGRGIARLLRIWSSHQRLKDWDVVLLLHGADDCSRIAREGPASLYSFPWLTPSHITAISAHNGSEDDIISLPGTSGYRLQPLTGLFKAS